VGNFNLHLRPNLKGTPCDAPYLWFGSVSPVSGSRRSVSLLGRCGSKRTLRFLYVMGCLHDPANV